MLSQVFILLLLVALAHFPLLSEADWARNALYHFRDRARPEPKAVALTFDDGPHQMLTPKLLDILKEKNAKATFYVMGIKTQLHPDIVSRAHKEGHEVANHVWDHPVLSKLKYEEVQSQLSKTTLEIEKAMGDVPKTMRPPYGNTNPRLNNYITQASNLTVVIWSLDTLDWKRPAPEEITKKVAETIKAGDIILCHDIHPSTIAAMPGLIDAVRAKGFELLTVSQLMASEYPAKVTVPDSSQNQQKLGNLRAAS
jgi:peptidoglycan/xylan/chitin deacetylase (PgdA/CDA1 family)